MEQQVNLYQPILGAEKRLFSARAIVVGICLLAASLGCLAAFGAWRTHRIESSIALLERQAAAGLAMAERASLAMRPAESIATLDAQAQELSADIAARERALEIVRRGSVTATTGFAARLEALARRQIDGVWLRSIVVGSGVGRLAMQGATTDPRLVPAYLAALAEERALDGVQFDKLAMHRASAEEAPAQMVFELGAPGVKFPARETVR